MLLAHHDAAHTGGVFRPGSVERRARIGARIRRPFGLAEVFFLALILLLGCCLVRLFLPESALLGVAQLVPTAALIGSIPLLLDIVFGRVVPGANDNASGVATVLALAELYGDRLALRSLVRPAGIGGGAGARHARVGVAPPGRARPLAHAVRRSRQGRRGHGPLRTQAGARLPADLRRPPSRTVRGDRARATHRRRRQGPRPRPAGTSRGRPATPPPPARAACGRYRSRA